MTAQSLRIAKSDPEKKPRVALNISRCAPKIQRHTQIKKRKKKKRKKIKERKTKNKGKIL